MPDRLGRLASVALRRECLDEPPSTSSSSARAKTRSREHRRRGCDRRRDACAGTVKRPRRCSDLNDVPAHDYSLIPVERYFALKGTRQIDYISSQGCRFRCAFCADPAVYRARLDGARCPSASPTRSRSCIERYGVEELAFQDETFFTHPPRVDALADEFLQRRPRRSRGPRRCAPIRRAAWARRSSRRRCAPGLRRVMVGVESGSQETLDRLQKDMQLEQVRVDRRDVRAPRRRRHLQLHRRFPGRVRREHRRRRSALAKRLRRMEPGVRDADLLLPAVSRQSDRRTRARATATCSRAASRRGPTSTTSAAAVRGSRATQWQQRRAVQVLHAARLAAGRVALAAARRVALALRARLVRACRSRRLLVELVRPPQQVS